MAIGPFEQQTGTAQYLGWLNSELASIAAVLRASSLVMPTSELAKNAIAIEEVARTVEQLQLISAHAIEHQNVAVVGESDQPLNLSTVSGEVADGSMNRTGCRDNAEYLRNTLRVSRSEAKRRIQLSGQVLPSVQLTGEPGVPKLEHLASAVAQSTVSSQAATLISAAVERMRPCASAEDLDAMELALTRQAAESDTDLLRVLIRRWEDLLNPDGAEPTEEMLRVRQGVFLRGKRRGLHYLEIAATDDQFESLVTVMYSATNPRARAGLSVADTEKLCGADQVAGRDDHLQDAALGDELDRSTWAQQLLDGLVGACGIALASNKLSTAGGMRPQVLVTIDYKELAAEVGRGGGAAFGGLMGARSIRRIACDANVLPVVLGTQGQVLDVGQLRRLFPPTLRKALVARDGGCAFPDCMMPSPWTEGHHIIHWSRGGVTSIDNGVLLCSRHHHLLHQGDWAIQVKDRVPWFVPPRYIDPAQRPRQNHYHRDRHRTLLS